MTAAELTAWAQLPAFGTGPARRWEPKRLRARIFDIAAKVTRHARTTVIHLAATALEATLCSRD